MALEKESAGCLDGMENEERVRTSSSELSLSRCGAYCGDHEFWVLRLKLDSSCNPLGLRLTCCWICCRLK